MTTIQTTLELIRRKLDDFLRKACPGNEDWVNLTSMVDHEGHAYERARDKVVMFLANIQHETNISTYNRLGPANDSHLAIVNPPVYIDLFVLFYANFAGNKYSQGLVMISQIISFFQQNPWFTDGNLPGLDQNIGKLSLEMVNLDLADLHCLMGMLGVKYLPSVYYKLRLIPFTSDLLSSPAA